MSDCRSRVLADGAGMGAAIGCAAHCLLTPWLIAMVPILAPLIASERAEVVFLAASLAVSGLTLLAARRRVHTCWTPVGIFWIAALVLVTVRVMGIVEQPMGAVLVVVAASLITVAHCANIRCCGRATEPTPRSSSTITRIAAETAP